jgi:hypothetical protein
MAFSGDAAVLRSLVLVVSFGQPPFLGASESVTTLQHAPLAGNDRRPFLLSLLTHFGYLVFALAQGKRFLFVTNFRAGTVEVYDANLKPV